VQAGKGQPATLRVRSPKGGAERIVNVVPVTDPKSGRWIMGLYLGSIDYPKPLSQLHYFSGTIFRTLRAFGREKERGEAAKSIGGPVMILSGMHSQVSLHPMQALWFTALININLAIINLLPIIILDGGHIMVALYEWILGRPPRKSIITLMANVMVVLLISMMVILSFRDVRLLDRIYSDHTPPSTPTPVTVEATPAP
jgi:regulator of sigma E protease